MIQKRYVIILALFVSATVAVVQAPAAWLAPFVAQASKGAVLMDRSWGTVWSGQAVFAFQRSTSERLVLPEAVAWQVKPSALLTGRVDAMLQLQGRDIAVNGTLLGDGAALSIAPGSYTLPASSLNSLGAPFNTLKLSGTVMANWATFTTPMYQPPTPPQVMVHIQNLSSKVIGQRILGSYTINVTPDSNGALRFHVSTQSPQDALQITAQGTINAKGAVQFELTAAPAKESERDGLQAILNLLGRRQGNVNVLKM